MLFHSHSHSRIVLLLSGYVLFFKMLSDTLIIIKIYLFLCFFLVVWKFQFQFRMEK